MRRLCELDGNAPPSPIPSRNNRSDNFRLFQTSHVHQPGDGCSQRPSPLHPRDTLGDHPTYFPRLPSYLIYRKSEQISIINSRRLPPRPRVDQDQEGFVSFPGYNDHHGQEYHDRRQDHDYHHQREREQWEGTMTPSGVVETIFTNKWMTNKACWTRCPKGLIKNKEVRKTKMLHGTGISVWKF